MFIRLKKPTFVLQGHAAAYALPQEVLLNLSRIGAVSFGAISHEIALADGGKTLGTVNAGDANTIRIALDGDVGELLPGSFAERQFVLVFPDNLHGEFQRIRRILESRVIES
jgi:hypothetical protein